MNREAAREAAKRAGLAYFGGVAAHPKAIEVVEELAAEGHVRITHRGDSGIDNAPEVHFETIT